jgi:hypothetical protein
LPAPVQAQVQQQAEVQQRAVRHPTEMPGAITPAISHRTRKRKRKLATHICDYCEKHATGSHTCLQCERHVHNLCCQPYLQELIFICKGCVDDFPHAEEHAEEPTELMLNSCGTHAL